MEKKHTENKNRCSSPIDNIHTDQKYRVKMIISWFSVIFWAAVIFYLSSRTAVESTVQSRNVIGVFESLIGKVTIDEATLEYVDGIVRECAHGVEYFIFGGLIYNALFRVFMYKSLSYFYERKKELTIIVKACIISVIYSISDEIHQIYVPGRSCQFLDLSIDFIGSLLGIVLVYFIFKIYYRSARIGLLRKSS